MTMRNVGYSASNAGAVAGVGGRSLRRVASAERSFDYAMTLLCTWLAAGFYIDGWAHNTDPGLETFFTPWHAVMYSGFGVTACFLLGTFGQRVGRGALAREALPPGYGLSLLGVCIFLVGGIGDLVWHELFGIESSVAALLSPSHLSLALGAVLILAGPMRAAAARPEARLGWSEALPLILSFTYVWSALTYMTQFIHPLGQTGAAIGYRDQLGRVSSGTEIAGFLVQSALMTGVLLLMTRRWQLPAGSLTVVLGINALLMTLMCQETLITGILPLIGAALITGLVADLVCVVLRPAMRLSALRLFAFCVPALYALLYFLALRVWGGGIWWTVHLWTGTIVLSGVAGLFVSLATVPPRGLEPVAERT